DVRRYATRDLQRRTRLAYGGLPLRLIADGARENRAPLIAGRQAIRNRRMNAVQREGRVRQPLDEQRDRRRVVVVEMTARREHFDRLEPVRCDGREMIAAESLVVVQVRRDAEAYGHSRRQCECRNQLLYHARSAELFDVGGGQLPHTGEPRL